MSLSHKDPDCTGEWGVHMRGEEQYWVCSACGKLGYMSVTNNDAAILDNLHGSKLARLADEGAKLLEDER